MKHNKESFQFDWVEIEVLEIVDNVFQWFHLLRMRKKVSTVLEHFSGTFDTHSFFLLSTFFFLQSFFSFFFSSLFSSIFSSSQERRDHYHHHSLINLNDLVTLLSIFVESSLSLSILSLSLFQFSVSFSIHLREKVSLTRRHKS